MAVHGAQEQITNELLMWDGVTARPIDLAGTEYVVGRREIGHIHGDQLVDIPFPTKVRNQVVAAGRAEPHHLLPKTGWVSCYLRTPADVTGAIELLRESYRLAAQRRAGTAAG